MSHRFEMTSKFLRSVPPRLRVSLPPALQSQPLFAQPVPPCVLPTAGCNSNSGPPRYKSPAKSPSKAKAVEEGHHLSDPATGQVNEGPLGSGGTYSTELPAGNYKVSVSPPLVETKPTADTPPTWSRKT